MGCSPSSRNASRSREPVTGNDARRSGTAALWLGALDLAVDFFTPRSRASAGRAGSGSSRVP